MKGRGAGRVLRCGATAILGLLAAGGALAGCTVSKVDSAAAVSLTGTVQDAAGNPVPGARVSMLKEADLGEFLTGATFALSTLGLACLVQHPPAFCARARTATSDASGHFTFHLKGSDTQGSVGNADNFDLAAAGTTVRFRVQQAALQIPPLRTWGASLDVTPAAGSSPIRVSRPSLPAAYGASPSYTLTFGDAGTQRPVWSVSPDPPATTVDPRVLEDRTGTLAVDARTTMAGPGTSFTFTYRSQQVPFAGQGPPPSRGDACVAGATGQPATALVPCRLTDGDLFTNVSLGSAGPTPVVHSSAAVDLGAVRPVSLVVVRGGSTPLQVQGSADAITWRTLGTTAGSPAAVSPAGAPPERYIRVQSPSGFDISGLTEISVWN